MSKLKVKSIWPSPSISHVPLKTTANVRAKTEGPWEWNDPGCGCKRKWLIRRMVQMVEPRKTSKDFQADLRGRGTSLSDRLIRHLWNNNWLYLRRSRTTSQFKNKTILCEKCVSTSRQVSLDWRDFCWVTCNRQKHGALKGKKNTVLTVKYGEGLIPWMAGGKKKKTWTFLKRASAVSSDVNPLRHVENAIERMHS